MNIHNNACLTFRGRELLVKRIVEQGLRVEEAEQASGVSVRTAYKWLRRYRQEGITGLYDRSSLSSSDLGSSSSGDCAAEASTADLPADQSAARCLSKHCRADPTEVGTESVFGT